MTVTMQPPICRFFRLIPGSPAPKRASRSADGMLSVRAYQYCEALASASAFGWYLYPPLNFSLFWDGVEVMWTYEGADGWYPLRGPKFPGFEHTFREMAPERLHDLMPTFLLEAREPGLVQIWSGYLVQTAPGWALLSRAPANIPRARDYHHFEGIIESDSWFGPLFTNIRLTRSNSPVEFHTRYPLLQVQPLLRPCYQEPSFEVVEATKFGADDWDRFEATMRPNADHMRRLGHYAVDTRKRLRKGISL